MSGHLKTQSVPALERAFNALELLAASKSGLTLPELALGYVRTRWFVGATIIGATTMAQLEENLQASQVDLDEQTLAEIASVMSYFPNPAP